MRFVERLIRRRPPGVPSGPAADFRGRLVRPVHVMSATRGGETVLLDPLRGRYHTLNDVGARVWDLLADGTTFEAIVGTIRAEYDVPRVGDVDPVEQDVTTLLRHLRAADLLIQETSGAAHES
jgi:Coenzyme PQQ synthesis protein D (PqqD)